MLVVFASCNHHSSAQGGKPSFTVGGLVEGGECQRDIGTIDSGSGVISVKYPVKNNGAETLEFESGVASCSCTSWDMQPRRLAPAEAGMVLLNLDPAGHKGLTSSTVILRTKSDSGMHFVDRFSVVSSVNVPIVLKVDPLWIEWTEGNIPAEPKIRVIAERQTDSSPTIQDLMVEHVGSAASVGGANGSNPVSLTSCVKEKDNPATWALSLAVAPITPPGTYYVDMILHCAGGKNYSAKATMNVVPRLGLVLTPQNVLLSESLHKTKQVVAIEGVETAEDVRVTGVPDGVIANLESTNEHVSLVISTRGDQLVKAGSYTIEVCADTRKGRITLGILK